MKIIILHGIRNTVAIVPDTSAIIGNFTELDPQDKNNLIKSNPEIQQAIQYLFGTIIQNNMPQIQQQIMHGLHAQGLLKSPKEAANDRAQENKEEPGKSSGIIIADR
jgi:hypothetical protein